MISLSPTRWFGAKSRNAFETAFHQTIPLARQVYGIPHEWTEKLGIRRYGFHGASHRYIATRMAELNPEAKRIISCHLGGSCSIIFERPSSTPPSMIPRCSVATGRSPSTTAS